MCVSVCSYGLRVQALLLKEEFPVLSAAMMRDISTLRTAAKGLTFNPRPGLLLGSRAPHRHLLAHT